jgi:alanyl-tRNA synthetase
MSKKGHWLILLICVLTLRDEELQQVEDFVNARIQEQLPLVKEETSQSSKL